MLLLLLLVAHGAAWRPPAPMRCPNARCELIGSHEDYQYFYQVDADEFWVMYYEPRGFLWLDCEGPRVSESKNLPRAVNKLYVWEVIISYCLLPKTGSIIDRLKWLNVQMLFDEVKVVRDKGYLSVDRLHSSSVLTAKHFAGLERLTRISIFTDYNLTVNAEYGFLSPLKSIRHMYINYVKLPEGELDVPWPTLEDLRLIYTGVNRLPETIYASSSLVNLTVEGDVPIDAVAVSPKMQHLELRSPQTRLQLDSVPALRTLDIEHWKEPQLQLLSDCYNLSKLYLTAPTMQMLPHGWLANCSKLEKVKIEKARNQSTLPRKLFGINVANLKHVAIKEGVLETLNEGQFDGEDSKSELLTLELNGNRLRKIPNNTFPTTLRKLDLSSNELDSGVLAVVAATAWDGLEHLNLGDNPGISISCDEDGYSPIRRIRSLKKLLLYNTNVSRLCRDWREDMPWLEELDLRNTSVARLTFQDLQIKRSVLATVLLEGAPVTQLELTRQDFEKLNRTPESDALIRLDVRTEMLCDCRMYWTRRALERVPWAFDRVRNLRCTGRVHLNDVDVESFVCSRPEECASASLPNRCRCSERPDDDPTRYAWIIRVECTGSGLDRVPRFPPSEDRLYELQLADNQIADVNARALDSVKILDLRNNLITKVDNETALRLGSLDKLWLAGNQLDCDCSAAPLLQALQNRTARYSDINSITCSDGTALKDAPIINCFRSKLYVIELVAFFALAVAVIACFAFRGVFAKSVLHWLGCLCLCCSKTDKSSIKHGRNEKDTLANIK